MASACCVGRLCLGIKFYRTALVGTAQCPEFRVEWEESKEDPGVWACSLLWGVCPGGAAWGLRWESRTGTFLPLPSVRL